MSEVYLESCKAETYQYLGRNYFLHAIEGGLYMGGMTFVAANTILPRMVECLNGPAWVVSLMPVIMGIGFSLPPLFTAHKIEKLQWVKPLVMVTGLFQRLPILLTALALLFLSETNHTLALASIVIAPFLSGLIGGFGATAWQELLIKTIPENRRSSLIAMRLVISTCMGIGAGAFITAILDEHPGTYGYGILHLIAFSFTLISYFLFGLVRETTNPPRNFEKNSGLIQNLKEIPHIIKRDHQFQFYLFSRAWNNGIYIMMPFLAIYAMRTLAKPDSFLGFLVTAQMAGGILGNILAGILGDRHGGKIVMLLSNLLYIALCIGAALARTEVAFLAIFFSMGTAFYANQVGMATLGFEICPFNKRSTYLSIISFISLPTQLFVSFLSATVWETTSHFPLLAMLSVLALTFSTLYLMRIIEPRKIQHFAD